MIPVGRLAPDKQWDQTLVEDLISGRLYDHGLEFKWYAGYPSQVDGAVVLTPARYWCGHEAEISMALSKYRWVLMFLTSDEEQLFDARKVVHPNCRFWIQTPRKGREYPEARFFGVGYPPHFRDLPVDPPVKTLSCFLSAQKTHTRREQCFTALEGVVGRVEATAGFTQGMDPAEYRNTMLKTKVAPAPSGAVSPDSFRFWEALEAHAVPLADTVSPVDGPTTYWEQLFPGYLPFPTYEDAAELKPLITQTLADLAIGNRVAAFWMRYKRVLAMWLREDLTDLGAV